MKHDERGIIAVASHTGITARTISYKGDFTKSKHWLERLVRKNPYEEILKKYAEKGVEALKIATPVRTGQTAQSWTYDISITKQNARIEWRNTNKPNGFDVAIALQYGHGTKNGGYVPGIDYINPALKPIFDSLAQEMWEELNRV